MFPPRISNGKSGKLLIDQHGTGPQLFEQGNESREIVAFATGAQE
jgi:hypothetical protein